MGILRTLSKRGDDQVMWDVTKAMQGDREAESAVREAERIFAEARAKGSVAFKINADKTSVRIADFDPQAEQIVIVPRVIGG